MYARYVLFTLGEGKRAVAENMAKKHQSAMQGLKGFKSATFIADENAGEYGSLSLWESKADAQAAESTLAPSFLLSLKGHVKRFPMRRVLEVFEA
jgi:heme-degrading monooxygenase HmoA